MLFLQFQIISMLLSTAAVIFHVIAARHVSKKDDTMLKNYRRYARTSTTVSIFFLGVAYILAWRNITTPSKHDVKINAVHLMMILFPATLLELYVSNKKD